jgi:hypothetical protein
MKEKKGEDIIGFSDAALRREGPETQLVVTTAHQQIRSLAAGALLMPRRYLRG